jgi:hypothetical protein
LAHKAEQVVDLDSGAVLAVTVKPGGQGIRPRPTTHDTMFETIQNFSQLSNADVGTRELVADKEYHSNDTLLAVGDVKMRSYSSEPDGGKRKCQGKEGAKQSVYANRRRIKVSEAGRFTERGASWSNGHSLTAWRRAGCDEYISAGTRSSRSVVSCTSRRSTSNC